MDSCGGVTVFPMTVEMTGGALGAFAAASNTAFGFKLAGGN